MAVTGWVSAMKNLKLEKEQTPKGMTCLEVKTFPEEVTIGWD